MGQWADETRDVKPWETLGEDQAPDGTRIVLARRDTEYVLLANGELLMSSRMHGSEEALATAACEAIAGRPRPRVLVGGLGMGFTLRAALDHLPPAATVVVAELVPAVVAWNRGVLGALAADPLSDQRVSVDIRDISTIIRPERGTFDAILLDVDNGAAPFAAGSNVRLYSPRGLAALHAALTPTGLLAVWSATDDRAFGRRLRSAGFTVEARRVRARHNGRGPRNTIFLARRVTAASSAS